MTVSELKRANNYLSEGTNCIENIANWEAIIAQLDSTIENETAQKEAANQQLQLANQNQQILNSQNEQLQIGFNAAISELTKEQEKTKKENRRKKLWRTTTAIGAVAIVALVLLL